MQPDPMSEIALHLLSIRRIEQIARQLRGQIQSGSLRFGDVIPGERELSDSLAVSRMTLRAAIDELVDEGLLLRQRGRGTVVAPAAAHIVFNVVGVVTILAVAR